MFSWHETTLRGFCRLAFGLLVAVPTCAVLLAVIWCRCPLSVEYYRRALAEQLALDVRLERVSFPQPHVTLYQGLTLIDPETTRPVARFRSVRCRTTGEKTLVTCQQAELSGSRLDLLTELVARRWRSFAGSRAVVEIEAQEATLRLADGLEPQRLTEVRGQLQGPPPAAPAAGQPDVPQATVEFRLAGHENEPPVRILFYHEASQQGATTSVKLETGPTPLPSRLIELCCPGWATWGLNSAFRGELSWQQRTDGPVGRVIGRVTDVDLDKLVSTRAGHRLSGMAEVQLDQARFQRGRLLDATGWIHAGRGLVGRSLLAAAASYLRAVGNNPVAARDDLAEYDEMAFSFKIDAHGVALQGLCSQLKGALFVGPSGPLLGEPPEPQSLRALAWMLANSKLVVPANPAAQSLLSVLPVPAPEPRKVDATPEAKRENDLRR